MIILCDSYYHSLFSEPEMFYWLRRCIQYSILIITIMINIYQFQILFSLVVSLDFYLDFKSYRSQAHLTETPFILYNPTTPRWICWRKSFKTSYELISIWWCIRHVRHLVAHKVEYFLSIFQSFINICNYL